MKNLLSILLFAFALPFVIQAKQIMTLTNGEELEVEIVSIGTNDITYKKASNPNGPSYSTNKSAVFFILFEDGTKEIITPLNAQPATTSVAGTTATDNSILSTSFNEDNKKKIVYYDKIRVYTRMGVGVQLTGGGLKDTPFGLEWDPLGISVETSVLIPSSRNTAWYIGIGYQWLDGKFSMFDDTHDYNLGNVTNHYLYIPVGSLFKCSRLFTFGAGLRPLILLSSKIDGENARDGFNSFRIPIYLEGLFTFGNFEIGPRLVCDFTNTFKGKGMDWSGSFGFEGVLGYRF